MANLDKDLSFFACSRPLLQLPNSLGEWELVELTLGSASRGTTPPLNLPPTFKGGTLMATSRILTVRGDLCGSLVPERGAKTLSFRCWYSLLLLPNPSAASAELQ